MLVLDAAPGHGVSASGAPWAAAPRLEAGAPPRWVLHPRHAPPRALELARALGAPPAFAHALVNRGIHELEDARRFLDPALDDLHDPLQLADLKPAADRIQRAIAGGERIFVQGDYDVDGITSTFLLLSALHELGGRTEHRIPHRTKDGYGLSVAAIEEASRLQCGLVITVDCGTTAHEPIARARELGMDTIVTDHHEPGGTLPPAFAVVNPRRKDCRYPFKSLAGVGVTFKLVEALFRGRGGLERACQYLDVVALGTIADAVPLVGENRVLVRDGLERLNRFPRHGLRALLEMVGLEGRRVSAGQVAFQLAPRLNAAGRMGSADQSLRLLFASDASEGRACAESLELDNTKRRTLDEAVGREAAERVEHELGWPACASILLWSDRWHPGVLGIVASRLVERFQRPAILVGLDGERGRGSGRSVAGLDLTRVLESCDDLLEGWGGHAFAAGLTVRRERLPELRARIESVVRERIDPEVCVPSLRIDADVTLSECDLDLVEWIERLAPHGLDNSEPVFRVAEAAVDAVSRVGHGKHLRMRVRDATGDAEVIGFGYADHADHLVRSGRCALAFAPGRNEWMGETRVQLRLKGVRAL